MFLWCMSVIYMIAFVSLYVQIPGETHNSAAHEAASSTNLVVCVSPLAEKLALPVCLCSSVFHGV